MGDSIRFRCRIGGSHATRRYCSCSITAKNSGGGGLQTALAPHTKYTVLASHQVTATKEVNLPSKSVTTYWPLILIGLFLLSISTGISWQQGGGMTLWMEVFMGGFFLVFSFFKFLDLPGFARSYRSYDLLAASCPPPMDTSTLF